MKSVCAQMPSTERRPYLCVVIESLVMLGQGADPISPLHCSETLKRLHPGDEVNFSAVRFEYVEGCDRFMHQINWRRHLWRCMLAIAMSPKRRFGIMQALVCKIVSSIVPFKTLYFQ